MIGRRWKRGDALSRAALMARKACPVGRESAGALREMSYGKRRKRRHDKVLLSFPVRDLKRNSWRL